MNTIRTVWGTVWRSVLVGVGYLVAMIVAGMLSSIGGAPTPASQGSGSQLAWLFISSILIGLFLGPLASRIAATRWQHFLIWTGVIFFNMGAVAIEGVFFAPELVPIPLPVLAGQQLLAALAAASLVTWLFAPPGKSMSWVQALRLRPWYQWAWRFVASAASYLVFYFVFGAINYALVTKPYYVSHSGGLTAPPPESVLVAELVRAPLIALSMLLFILSVRTSRRRLIVMTGLMLFWVGGVVPLVMQASTLPPLLLVASGVEIFFQNFLTGLVAAVLLGTRKENRGKQQV